MRCEYKDDFKVDYAGALRITKGDGIDLVVKEAQIPANIKSSLQAAVTHNSCHELRSAAKTFAKTINQAFERE